MLFSEQVYAKYCCELITNGKIFILQKFLLKVCSTKDINVYIVSHPLFADVDTAIYPHVALQYHVGPNAKFGILMLGVINSHILISTYKYCDTQS